MRIEGNNHRFGILGLRSAHDLIDHMAMRAVNAIEITDTDNRGAKVVRDVIELVKSLHSRVNHRRDAEIAEIL